MIKKTNSSVIKFEKVGKRFFRQQTKTLKEMIPALIAQGAPGRFIWALDDINFSIAKGETLGIVGNNGSGKTTLLQIIAGVTSPTRGKVSIQGRVSPLIQLGAGFHPELSGRENIYLNGAILGLTQKEIRKRFKKIVDFSELWDFIEMPLKHYSSGMKMRLGFSVAIHVDPEILLIDEVFAVGDTEFRKKCFGVFEKFKKSRVTIVIVSHSMEMICRHCDRVIILHEGKITAEGEARKVVELYQNKFAKEGWRERKKA